MQIIKISHLTKVAIKTRTSRFFHRNLSGSPDIRTEIHKKNAQLPQKTREFLRKTREESKESPLVFHPTLRHREEYPHSFKKTKLLKTKTLRSATDAPLPTLFPTALRCLDSASRLAFSRWRGANDLWLMTKDDHIICRTFHGAFSI